MCIPVDAAGGRCGKGPRGPRVQGAVLRLCLTAAVGLAVASSARADPAVDALLAQPVGERSLEESLRDARPGGCMGTHRGEWRTALRACGRWWRRQRELDRRRAAAGWRRLGREASAHGRLLLDALAHSEDLALQQLLCEDALPLPRRGLTADGFVDSAVPLLQAAARRPGPAAEGRAGLRDLRAQLLDRFDAMFEAAPQARGDLVLLLDHVAAGDLGRGVMAGDLGFARDPARRTGEAPVRLPVGDDLLAWGVHFDRVLRGLPSDPAPDGAVPLPRAPRHMGWDRLLGDPTVEPSVVPQVFAPPLSADVVEVDLLDPKDAVELLATLDGWTRQVAALQADARRHRRDLRGLRRQIHRGNDVDGAAAGAERARRSLQRAAADLARQQEQIQGWRTSRPCLDRILDGPLRRGPIEALERTRRRAVRDERQARVVVDEAVAAGAAPPGDRGPDGEGLEALLADARAGRAARAGATRVPGRSTDPAAPAAGPPALPASEPGRAPAPEVATERRWSGPLPHPRDGWDPSLVRWVARVHPQLDELDVALLFELVARAVPEADGPGVEAIVRQTLDAWGSLRLRGGEARLSDVYDPERPEAEQLEVVFVVALREPSCGAPALPTGWAARRGPATLRSLSSPGVPWPPNASSACCPRAPRSSARWACATAWSASATSATTPPASPTCRRSPRRS